MTFKKRPEWNKRIDSELINGKILTNIWLFFLLIQIKNSALHQWAPTQLFPRNCFPMVLKYEPPESGLLLHSFFNKCIHTNHIYCYNVITPQTEVFKGLKASSYLCLTNSARIPFPGAQFHHMSYVIWGRLVSLRWSYPPSHQPWCSLQALLDRNGRTMGSPKVASFSQSPDRWGCGLFCYPRIDHCKVLPCKVSVSFILTSPLLLPLLLLQQQARQGNGRSYPAKIHIPTSLASSIGEE